MKNKSGNVRNCSRYVEGCKYTSFGVNNILALLKNTYSTRPWMNWSGIIQMIWLSRQTHARHLKTQNNVFKDTDLQSSNSNLVDDAARAKRC